MRQYAYFNELPIKTEFSLNGNRYVKVSTKTACLPKYSGLLFYMGAGELCIVGPHTRLAPDYFKRAHK